MNNLGLDNTPFCFPQTQENGPHIEEREIQEDSLFPELQQEETAILTTEKKVTNVQRLNNLEKSNRLLLQRITQMGARNSADLEGSANMQQQISQLEGSLTNLQNREIALRETTNNQGQALKTLKVDFTKFASKCIKQSDNVKELRGEIDLLKAEDEICIDGIVAILEEKKKFEERVTNERKSETDFVIGSAEWAKKYIENTQIVADWNQFIFNVRLVFGAISAGTIGLSAGVGIEEARVYYSPHFNEFIVFGSLLGLCGGMALGGAVVDAGDYPGPERVRAAKKWLEENQAPAAPDLPTPEVRELNPKIERMLTLIQDKLRKRENEFRV